MKNVVSCDSCRELKKDLDKPERWSFILKQNAMLWKEKYKMTPIWNNEMGIEKLIKLRNKNNWM